MSPRKGINPGKECGRIYKTNAYALFRFLHGNRNIGKLLRLTRSIERRNLLSMYPILVWKDPRTGFLYIIDGQHRFSVAQQLGLDIYYILTDRKPSVEEIAMANEATMKWNEKMHLQSQVDRGNEEYKKIWQWIERHPDARNVLTIASLLSGHGGANGGEFRELFTTGQIKVTSIDHADRVWSIADLLHKNGIDFAKGRAMIRAISIMVQHPKFDEANFRRAAKWAKEKLYPSSRSNQLLECLGELYNYRSRVEKIDFLAHHRAELQAMHADNLRILHTRRAAKKK